MLHDLRGTGPPILLVHGLMGAAATWTTVAGWLGAHGHVWAADAPGHRGRAEPGLGHLGRAEPGPWTTERFVDELEAVLETVASPAEPAVLWGHSMGGLHAWVLAARRPDLVRGLVVEDMAPDFRGYTAAGWSTRTRQWPPVFDEAALVSEFGEVAGAYFRQAFTRTPQGWVCHGEPAVWGEIAAHWGTREHWDAWRGVRCEVLLLQAEHTVTPPGQMAEMAAAGPHVSRLVVAGSGHLVHGHAPEVVRVAVEQLLERLPAG
ncbi:MAG: alpha/beta hydrolase [Mycobacteriaceae bacterium]